MNFDEIGFVCVFDSQMWEDIIMKAKDGGLDVIETYVFWNVHEPAPGVVIIISLFLSFPFPLKKNYTKFKLFVVQYCIDLKF